MRRREEAAGKAEHIARREAEEAATGEKKRCRKPSPPDPEPAADEKVNLTDSDSRLMKTREWRPARRFLPRFTRERGWAGRFSRRRRVQVSRATGSHPGNIPASRRTRLVI